MNVPEGAAQLSQGDLKTLATVLEKLDSTTGTVVEGTVTIYDEDGDAHRVNLNYDGEGGYHFITVPSEWKYDEQ